MTKAKKNSVQGAGSVLVSRNLQLVFVALSALALLVQVAGYGAMMIGGPGVQIEYFIPMLATYIFLPLVFFAAAYWLGPGYPDKLQRIFIAVLKATAAIAVVTVLQSLMQYGVMAYMSGTDTGGMPPSWVTSQWPAAIIDIIVLILFVATLWQARRRWA